MEYDSPRRCLPHALSYPNYYYSDRNAPLALSHTTTRGTPRDYPIGGPVGGMQNRPTGREEPGVKTGPARSRIAVACARCRKRKIRCSVDPRSGSSCLNCKQAGVDPNHCQFYRVGSDNLYKVVDTMNMAHGLSGMANSHNMMSIYSTGVNNGIYPRYPQVDTKPVYSSAWPVSYPEDTSPGDAYNLDQPPPYLPNPTPMAIPNSNSYVPSCRWSIPNTKSMHHGTNAYFDQESSYTAHGMPYMPTNGRPSTANDALSPLNMSAMQMALPERPRQPHPSDTAAPQRQLPMPQPSPAQTSRNVVDQLQDQRLRSAQAMGASTVDSRGSFAKPLLPWSADGDGQININMSGATSTNGAAHVVSSAQLSDTTEAAMSYLPTTTSMTDDAGATSTAPQLQLNFSTSSLLDAMSASAPPTTYSNFRETRAPTSSLSQMARQSSQTNLYSFNTDHVSKRNSQVGEASIDCTLVSGHRYTPLNHSQPQSSPGRHNMHRAPCQSRDMPLHRASISNQNSTY
ncbi:hypothetical protein EJ02DRAFT_505072 [Clathrospora elynae]|uniref:Zn(2)-C6 fungal-type domain-containing protein n=1 Tax=Clathrospora elynae TaxID=706981 RepID=A0A6A5SEE2_9PLEO|nr:hypothetical protein EJ02DRAFT_505072 [Clathrospora elynae]